MARDRLAQARVARLATADAHGRPHVVAVCFAVARDTIYSAVDHKPKRTTRLRRLDNAGANPQVAVLADHYEDADWSRLWWVRADGLARVLEPNCGEAQSALDLLTERYPQYRRHRPEGPVLAVDAQCWSGWEAGG